MSNIKNIQEPLLSLEEVSIIPSKITKIHSRTNECNARMDNGKLPVFVAPMDSVINKDNFDLFNKDFTAIYPRTISMADRIRLLTQYDDKWIAFGLNETSVLCDMIDNGMLNLMGRVHICIDQANGHMDDLIRIGKRLRERLVTKDSEIMVGNIANPRTYTTLAYNDFADWVRVGIGGGSACTTSVQTGVHYPMASLVSECHYYKSAFEFGNKRMLKIVADGGINRSDHICKCLALGADAVMCGRLFASCEESASPYVHTSGDVGTDQTIRIKEYWGMSTKRAQRNMGGEGNKNSEGVVRRILVDGTLEERTEQIESSIKSAMSYCNAHNLNEFRINAILSRITPTSFDSYNKEIQNV